jgi:hypothetical protein
MDRRREGQLVRLEDDVASAPRLQTAGHAAPHGARAVRVLWGRRRPSGRARRLYRLIPWDCFNRSARGRAECG